MGKYSPESQQRINAHATVIWTLVESWTPGLGVGAKSEPATVSSKAKDLSNSDKIIPMEEDPLSETTLKGGPKVAELPEDFVDSKGLIEELNINPKLLDIQRKKLQNVIVKNQRPFGLDDRLGHLNVKVQIPLKPEAKELCLPPFHTLPANQQVINKQMDKWIQLGVIETFINTIYFRLCA
jgi:hypothetical protein